MLMVVMFFTFLVYVPPAVAIWWFLAETLVGYALMVLVGGALALCVTYSASTQQLLQHGALLSGVRRICMRLLMLLFSLVVVVATAAVLVLLHHGYSNMPLSLVFVPAAVTLSAMWFALTGLLAHAQLQPADRALELQARLLGENPAMPL